MTTILCLLAFASPTTPPSELPLDATTAAPTFELVFGPGSPSSSTRAMVPLAEMPELEYTYVELSYVSVDSDLVDDTLDGWDLTGSLELPMNFFVQGTATEQSGDSDVTRYRVGAGWHMGFTSRLDAYGILSYEYLDVSGADSDDGVSGELGLRVMLTPKIEVNARGLWVDVEDSDGGGGVGGRFYFTDFLSVGARFDSVGGEDTIAAGLRFEI